jgi:cytochrome P450
MTDDLEAEVRAMLRSELRYCINPHPVLDRMRDQGAVYDLGPIYLLSTYEDVSATLRDTNRFSNTLTEGSYFQVQLAAVAPEDRDLFYEMVAFESRSMQRNDDPEHGQLRGPLMGHFTQRRMTTLRDNARVIAEDLLDRIPDGEPIDFVAEFAFRLPLLVILRLLGVPEDDFDLLHDWSMAWGDFKSRPAQVRRARAATISLSAYVEDLIEGRRQLDPDGLLARLAANSRENGYQLSDLALTAQLLIFAGHETTTSLLAGGMLALMNNPEQFELMRQDTSLVPSAVEELLRYHSPTQVLLRRQKDDTEIAGYPIAKNKSVLCLVGAANRDPARYVDPHSVDVTRDHSRPLGFGAGAHLCVGAALARMETQVALTAIMERYASVAQSGEAIWRPNFTLRVPDVVPVTFKRA